MAQFEKTLDRIWFVWVGKRHKTIEGRPLDNDVIDMRVGDHIIFKCKDDLFVNVNIEVVITHINQYDGFYEMLMNEKPENVLPMYTDVDAGLKVYHSIPGYEDRARKNGVVAIHFYIRPH